MSFLNTQVSGQTLQIKGKLIDANSKAGVPFAHIALCGSTQGTSSNEDGEFRLNLRSDNQDDSVCVSCIGYHLLKISLKSIQTQIAQEWTLSPHVESLQEIIISDEKVPSVIKIVNKALQKIPHNYASEPYLMEGYYRDYLVKDNEYENILEAAIGIYDGGFHTQDTWTRVKIYQSRYSKGVPIDYTGVYENNLGGRSGHVNIVGGNTMSVLMFNNPIRNYNRDASPKTGYELDQSFSLAHNFELSGISYLNDEKVYCIQVEANQNHEQFQNLRMVNKEEASYQIGGTLYIRDRDFAILRFEYHIIQDQNPQALNQLRVEYKEYEGKMYLNYLSFANHLRLKSDFKVEQFVHFRELFINQLRTEDLPSPDEFYLFSRIQQIHRQEYLSDPHFWDRYNMVLQKNFGN
ncbi:MAG: carboxypeptidase-like regulatory domain-containing protein [Microscillaceae bacterium]|nr:carboxypeptidase-like regulatory domain-containing protein [Microscillaceae bacterium]